MPFSQILKNHRSAFISREKKTFREILGAHTLCEEEILSLISAMESEIEDSKAAGEEAGIGWLHSNFRLKKFLKRAEEILNEFADKIAPIIFREKEIAAKEGIRFAAQILNLDPEEFLKKHAYGKSGDDLAVRDYFKAKLIPLILEKLKECLIRSIAAGSPLLKEKIKKTLNIARYKSLGLARNRSYQTFRESALYLFKK